jgi:DNA-binding response OmpR family regulator
VAERSPSLPSLVLVIEDESAIGRPLTNALRGQGYHVRWALTAQEALSMAAAEPPALILLDLGLPDLDGVELCRRLRTLVHSSVIVVLSARAESTDVMVGIEAGAHDYLTKPFKLSALLATVGAHLRWQNPGPGRAQDQNGEDFEVGAAGPDRRSRWITTESSSSHPGPQSVT